mgnify:CR=1 FL=1
MNAFNSITKVGKDVRLKLGIAANSLHVLNTTFATVPIGFRPVSLEFINAFTYVQGTMYSCIVQITTQGEIQIANSEATLSKYIIIELTYKTA